MQVDKSRRPNFADHSFSLYFKMRTYYISVVLSTTLMHTRNGYSRNLLLVLDFLQRGISTAMIESRLWRIYLNRLSNKYFNLNIVSLMRVTFLRERFVVEIL